MFKREDSAYGQNYLIRDYCGYSRWLPLPCHCEHGIYLTSKPLLSDIEFPNNRLMLVMNKKRLGEWKKTTNIDVAVSGSLFVHYRRKYRIEQRGDACGTLVFAVHSTELIDSDYSIESFCDELKQLPAKFLPVTICLHWQDMLKKRDKPFKLAGLEVVTAGPTDSLVFARNFYSILSKYKYSTSNFPGSYLFYAVEMGVPFFLMGTEVPSLLNHGNDPNVPQKFSIFDFDFGMETYNMFNMGPVERITEAQRNFVIDALGVNDCLSPKELNKLLWTTFWSDKKLQKYTLHYYKDHYIRQPIVKVIAFCGLKEFMKSMKNRLKYYQKNLCVKVRTFNQRIRSHWYFLKEGLREDASIFTHLTDQEKVALHVVTKNIKTDGRPVGVEIGSYLGASSCFIAEGIGRKNGSLFCIDTWQNQTMPEGESDTFNVFLYNTKKYRNVIVPLRGWSDVMVNDFKQKETNIDFLFVDGDHSYESCKKDWDLYGPLMKHGAIVAFHDTGWADGVNRVIRESVIPIADCLVALPNMQVFRIKEKR